MKNIIVREYLESLKEDSELDLIFPLLLEALGFRIITTPKEYRGHKQYGKDFIAIGIDPLDRIRKRFYFELKGGDDRDINTTVFTKDDGVRMSLLEAKDKTFNEPSIKGFDGLPIKIILVHNGVLKPDVSETFKGFIEREYPSSGSYEFERWDIYKLSELFSKHLFHEYILTNDENIRLFKRALVFMDVPHNSLNNFYELVNNIISGTSKGALKKNYFPPHILRLFETLKLLARVIHQYAKENNNLDISKKCCSYLILRTWSWIISQEIYCYKKVITKFQQLLNIQNEALDDYFFKTLPVAQSPYGLFSENGGRYEQIGYPIRSFEYLGLLTYWLRTSNNEDLTIEDRLQILSKVISNNDGTCRPIIDVHSIPICLTIMYFIDNGQVDTAKNYLRDVLGQIALTKNMSGRIPDGKNRVESVIRLIVKGEKSIYYVDTVSMLIGMLFEWLAILDMEEEYYKFMETFRSIRLVTFEPYTDEETSIYHPEQEKSHEGSLFEKGIYKEGFQSELLLDESFKRFSSKIKSKRVDKTNYHIDNCGFIHLRHLAHLFYSTPIFPWEWRSRQNLWH